VSQLSPSLPASAGAAGGVPDIGAAPFDPAVLARLATAMFAAPPGASPLPGVQAPGNIAPPGSPLVSPAGFGPSVPGTPIPQGQVPGTNLLPGSPLQVLSLGNRAPALLPAAQAGNGVPDKALSAIPAYEPRSGGALLGVPTAPETSAPSAGNASPYYFLNHNHGQSPSLKDIPLDLDVSLLPSERALTAAPATGLPGQTSAAAAPAATTSSTPQYYFATASTK
jgi:cysteine desulfurase/selenocysteine lyase